MKQGYMDHNRKKFIYIPRKIFLFALIALFSFACSKSAVKTDTFDPEASIAKADKLIKDGYYDDARVVLEEVKAKDASQEYATMAKLRIADSYFIDDRYDEAAGEYESFLTIHTHHKYSSYAQFRLAMTYFKRISTVDVSYSWAQKAIKEFEKLQRSYPRNPYMEITDSRITMCKRLLAEYEYYVGEFYYKKGSYSSAANRFQGMIDNYPGSKMEPDALYYLGSSYVMIGQKLKAVTVLSTLIENFPSIERTADAKKMLAAIKNMPYLTIKR